MTGLPGRGIVGTSEPSASWRRALLSSVALVALAVLVVAVPVGLLLLGGVPLAHTGVAGMVRAASGRTPDDQRLIRQWLTQGGLLLAWMAWAWMTVCVVLEFRALARGRSPRRLPASRTLQSLAACLVGTALALSAAGRGPSVATSSADAVSVGAKSSEPVIRVINEALPFSVDTWDRLSDSSSERSFGIGPGWEASDLVVLTPPGGRVDRSVGPVGTFELGDPTVADERPIEERIDSERVIGSEVTPTATATATATVEVPANASASAKATGSDGWPDLPSVHLVKSRETLWSIATEKLGTALRWQEIAELNYGLKQADGGELRSDHWIKPGWRLLLPRAPQGPSSASGAGELGQQRPVSATGSDPTLNDQPDRRLGQLVDRPTLLSKMHPIREGRFLSPTAPAPAPPPPTGLPLLPEVPGLTDLPLGPRTLPSPVASSNQQQVLSGSGTQKDGRMEPVRRALPPYVPVGAGVVGAGVVRIIDRMRRAQQRHRQDGRFIRLPDEPHLQIEQRLRLGEYGSIVDEVDRSLHRVMPSMRRSGRNVPVVAGARMRPNSIELIIDEFDTLDDLDQSPAREPSDLEDRTVVVEREAVLSTRSEEESATWRRSPAPLLVSAGRGPDGVVLVNLEVLGSLAIEGAPEETEGFVRALALELATSHWSGRFDLTVVGFGVELERFDRVSSAKDGQSLIDQLSRRQLTGRERLRTTGYASFAQARWIEDTDLWDPSVVVCGPEVAVDLVADLLECASDPRLGTVVVAAGRHPLARHVVSLFGDGRSLGLGNLSSVVFPQRVEPAELDAVAALLDTAANHQAVLASEEPYVNLPIVLPASAGKRHAFSSLEPGSLPSASGATALSAPAIDQSEVLWEGVLVAVLGPVEVRGAARAFTRAWARELVVYLAMHPNGARNEAWATALWPDRLMAASSLYSTASVARRSLGQTPDGADHLPRSHGRLALAPSVTTDWDQFVSLADSDDSDRWRSALELVRGRPFEGLRASDWPILEGIGPAIESAVVDLSGRLAGACMRRGDPRGAEWAARKGLLVSPYDERLYRMLMRAADLGGNPAGVEAVMSELVRLVADDIEPFDSVHPSTMDLYRSLTRRNPPTGRTRQL